MELNYTQRLLILSLAGLTVLRWALAGLLDLTPHEAALGEFVRVPAAAGVDGGSGAAWLSAVSVSVFGRTSFGVRFFAPLLVAGASWMLFRISRSLCGEKTAAWAVALFNLIPLVNLAAIQMRPETPGVFFLIAGMSAVWRGVRRASPWDLHWPAAGLLFGAGFLCWYGAAWGVAGTLLLLAGSRRWRRILRRPGPWLMLVDFALCGWLLWEWNRRHAFAGWHTLRNSILPHGGAPAWTGPAELAGQWLPGVTPVILGAMVYASVRAVTEWRVSDAARFGAAYAVPPVVAALAASVRADTGPESIAASLPALCMLVPWAWENGIRELRVRHRLQWLCVLPALVLSPAALDTDLLRHAGIGIPYAKDASRRWRGWRATAAEVERVVRAAAEHTGREVLLIARDERLAAVLDFYLPADLPALVPSPAYPRVHTLPSPVPDNDAFFRPRFDDAEAVRTGAFAGAAALYFTDSAAAVPPEPLRSRFASVTPVAVWDVLQGGLPLRRIRAFACHEFLP